MKKTILSIAVIAAAFVAASCQKENPQENNASEGNASVFTATIETGADTKTTVERVDGTPATYKTKWENTDKISINGVTYTATPDATDASKATFTKDSGDGPTAPFYAYSPGTMYSNGKATLPASYTYADGKYNMPMYAAEGETTSLSFKNLCGVLAIKVSGADFTSVEKIEVFSDKQMNGEFTATAEGVLSFASVTLTDALKKVTLDASASPKTIESDGSATFYIPVPPDTHNPLTIKVTGGSTSKLMVTKKSGGVAVARNTVYPIAFNGQPTTGTAKRTGDIDVNWVQLWAGGPKFAEYNAGAENYKAEDSGGYYAWGGSQDKVDDDYNTGSANLSGDSDTATKLWGGNWRMPTSAELSNAEDGLLYECICTWTTDYKGTGVTGLLCTGKGAYASNSVFLPAAGYCFYGTVTDQGDRGNYWSSTPIGGDSAYSLYFDSGDQYVYGEARFTVFSVRAVLAEED